MPPPAPNSLNTIATAVAFDNSQELIWAGNEYVSVLASEVCFHRVLINPQGRVSSFYGTEMQKYTCWRAHPEAEGPVKQILVCDKGVLSVSAKSVHLASKRGLTQWHIR